MSNLNNDIPTDSAETRIWELQEWETMTQYMYFYTYYLSQAAPRSVIGAYRTYVAQKKDVPIDDPSIIKIRLVATNWKRNAYGLDSSGKKKPEPATSWKKRAAAYDAFQVRKLNELTEQRKTQATFAALDTIDMMLARWQEMFELARLLKTTSRQEMDIEYFDDDGTPIPAKKIIEVRRVNQGQMRSLFRAFDDLRTMQRRELGQPSEIRQNNIADNEGGEFSAVGKGFADLLTDAFQEIQEYKESLNKNEDSE